MDLQDNSTLEQVRLAVRNTLLPKYGESESAALARLILTSLKGWDLPHLMANENREAGPFIVNKVKEITTQLLADVPVQYALGTASFYGLTLSVGPGVLIPRPETEELVEMIIKDNPAPDLKVLDLCTGSGAIALALARNLRFPRIEAIDISPSALAYAKENASKLRVSVKFLKEDIFTVSFDAEEFDIIVSNPPYVDDSEKKEIEANVLKYEPHEALFVPDDNPLVFYNRIAMIAAYSLKPQGKLYLEINPRHAYELKDLLENHHLTDVEIIKDLHGKDRFIKAIKA